MRLKVKQPSCHFEDKSYLQRMVELLGRIKSSSLDSYISSELTSVNSLFYPNWTFCLSSRFSEVSLTHFQADSPGWNRVTATVAIEHFRPAETELQWSQPTSTPEGTIWTEKFILGYTSLWLSLLGISMNSDRQGTSPNRQRDRGWGLGNSSFFTNYNVTESIHPHWGRQTQCLWGMALHLNRETGHYLKELLNRSDWTGLKNIKHLVIFFFPRSKEWEVWKIFKVRNLHFLYLFQM